VTRFFFVRGKAILFTMDNMKLPLLLIGLFLLLSCQTRETSKVVDDPEFTESPTDPSTSYPADMTDVFTAHGGIEAWQNMQALSFEIEKEEGTEKHFINLWDRHDRVEGANFTMGFDGSNVWIKADSTYKGDPTFYHNLMFYFYAMPYVLGDEGIKYLETEPLEFDGITYPGIRIAYNQGVGVSSKDEYFIHYHPETKQMAWLGYTVTYFSQEASSDVHWIRYDHWQEINGLKLPKSVSWYNYQDGQPVDLRNTVSFTNVTLSTQELDQALFEKPTGAVIQ